MTRARSGRAHHFDGRTAEARPATAVVEGRWLAIHPQGGPAIHWPLDDLRRLPDQAGGALVLRHVREPLSRLVLDDPETRAQVEAGARRLRRPVRRARSAWPLLAWGVGAVASVALMIGVLLPAAADRLAPLLPPGGEVALGDATLARIREALSPHGPGFPVPVCEAPDGLAALEAMTARLTDGLRLPHEPVVSVLDHEMVNAFALPGGRVVLFRGLIEVAEDPDEIAAVLAHELGHVAARDPTRMALRSAGSVGVLGLLFGDFAGGALVLFLLNTSIEASYSREAETAADAFAHARMEAAGLPPEALASMFERLKALGGEVPPVLEHFVGHPALRARIEAARDGPGAASGPPSLDAEGWAALEAICRPSGAP